MSKSVLVIDTPECCIDCEMEVVDNPELLQEVHK